MDSALHTIEPASADELGVCQATESSGGFVLDYRIHYAALPERVFAALTSEVGRWWPHTWKDDALAVVLEPRLGGSFMELWDEAGAGVVYGHVEVYDPPRCLRIRGSVGMNLAVNVMWTVTLEAQAGGTLLRELARISGETSPRLMEGMRRGTEEEYGVHLRAWLEQGTALR
jgi:hypothetical protein